MLYVKPNGTGILVHTIAGECYRENITTSTLFHQEHCRVFHRDFGAETGPGLSKLDAYRAAAQADPGDPGILNTLGYAEALAGNLREARAAFAEYGREPGQAVNALDSLGEGLFLNGNFKEAEQAFLQALAVQTNRRRGARNIRRDGTDARLVR